MTTLPKPDRRDRESAVLPVAERLRITEIFYSLQGEARTMGLPTAFVRLPGCPLRCGYCDTEYAFSGGEWMSLEDILARVSEYRPRDFTGTGGGPAAHGPGRGASPALCRSGYG